MGNSAVCPVCLGLPGSLPVLNRQVVVFATRVALALNCQIQPHTKFDRKHYFYPDLPKNFQISQYDLPFCRNGWLEVAREGAVTKIPILRVHIEEDAGKLLHDPRGGVSLVDYNRTGVPLLEIVSEPAIRSPEEAQAYLVQLKSVLRYLDISECNMEQGSLRCDANISLRPVGTPTLGTKAEVKNLNSFKAVKEALAFEIQRQTQQLGRSERIVQETRLWDADRGITASMRSKEEAHDYRYFPEPDLPPLALGADEIEAVRRALPELPAAKRLRFTEQYGLPPYDAGVLTQEASLAAYFEASVAAYPKQWSPGGATSRSATSPVQAGVGDKGPKRIANWIMTELLSQIDPERLRVEEYPVPPAQLAELVRLVDEGTISGRIAKEVFPAMIASQASASAIIQARGLTQISDTGALAQVVEQVLSEQRAVVEEFLGGKTTAANFLKGQVMKKTQGQANPQVVDTVLREQLERLRAAAPRP
jgi:aspartyl-tRNA(Asn)/glutamyl-tRNA(Gln) amidotransferase subunit B